MMIYRLIKTFKHRNKIGSIVARVDLMALKVNPAFQHHPSLQRARPSGHRRTRACGQKEGLAGPSWSTLAPGHEWFACEVMGVFIYI